jgi:hypothetical protein
VPPARSFRLAALGAVVVLAASGCATGPRPSLGDVADLGGATGSPVANPAIDTVVSTLEQTAADDTGTFTATYKITRKLGGATTTATVVHDKAATSVTVGDVRFLIGDELDTCSLSKKTCEDGTLDARISDYSIGSGFWAANPARALRVSSTRTTAAPTASSKTVGGVTATCVTVPVGGGSEVYCSVPGGPLAVWNTAAVDVELQSFAKTADQAAFSVPGTDASIDPGEDDNATDDNGDPEGAQLPPPSGVTTTVTTLAP